MKEAFVLFKNMKSSMGHVLFWCVAPLIIGFSIPPLVIFCFEVFVAHNDPTASLKKILHDQIVDGPILFIFFTAVELIPFAALSMVCFIAAHRFSPARLACLGICGLLGILGFMIPAHVCLWYPLYFGGHTSSTAVIALFFIPFYCLGTLGIGLLIGWGILLLPCFRKKLSQ